MEGEVAAERSVIPSLVTQQREALLGAWLQELAGGTALQSGKIPQAELQAHAARFLDGLASGLRSGTVTELKAAEWSEARRNLDELSKSWAAAGFTPAETATFVLSLKQPLFTLLRRQVKSADDLADEVWTIT